jgi:hypothetical protein
MEQAPRVFAVVGEHPTSLEARAHDLGGMRLARYH